MAARSAPRKLEVTILCTDPLVEKRKGVGPVKVKLDPEPALADGPTSARVAVVDYNADLDQVFAPARRRADGRGYAVGRLSDPRRNAAFRQVNVWAIVDRTLAMLEGEQLLGRPIPWASGLGRLLVLPHAGYGSNAFYDRGTGALHFLYFEGRQGEPVFTCLSHDIVSHELGHAVLDGLKPYFNEVTTAEAAGFHEFFADAVALSSSFSFREILVRATGGATRELDETLLGRIAAEFGAAMPGGLDYLRAAGEKVTLAQLEGVEEEHRYSQVLTNAFFAFFRGLYAKRLRAAGAGANGGDAVRSLVNAARQASRTFFRALDYCAPVDVTYLDYARALLRADAVAYPGDEAGARRALTRLFLERGVGRSEAELRPALPLENRELGRFSVEDVASTREAAYRFLDANRKALRIPHAANLRVATLARTRKASASGFYPPRELLLEFVWSEDVSLGESAGPLAGKRFPLWCGGTLVFDLDGNVRSYALRLGTQERRDRVVRYLDYLARRGRLGVAHEGRAAPENRPVLAFVDEDGGVRLRRVPALRHQGRS